jgi:hypothetical protein
LPPVTKAIFSASLPMISLFGTPPAQRPSAYAPIDISRPRPD